MACFYPAKFLIALFLLSFARGVFGLIFDWILTKDAIEKYADVFFDRIRGGDPGLGVGDGTNIRSSVSCSSLTMNNYTWYLGSDFWVWYGDPSKYAIGFWVNFESTIGDESFLFGSRTGVSFRVSSLIEGELILKAYSDEFTTNASDDLNITVPMSNFNIDEWIFLVFQFADYGHANVEETVLVPGHAAYTKTTAGNSFHQPLGWFNFGNSIKAKFYECVLASLSEMGNDLLTITLYDYYTPYNFTIPCTGDCPDTQCTYDGKCLSKIELCDSCSEGSCKSCSDVSLDPDTYCNSCNSSFTLKNGKCNFYLGCADANNCITCSTASTICDSCPTGYFLYKESVSSTSCISCDDSCTDCSPDPNCFNCAELVVESGDICEVESVGFQIAFDTPNIVFDFAYPLSSDLTKNSIKATTIEGADIPTTTWTFTDCTAGSIQCIIGTDLEENDIPIIIDFDFAQA